MKEVMQGSQLNIDTVNEPEDQHRIGLLINKPNHVGT